MDMRIDNIEPGSGRMTVRSVSHHTLTRDSRPSPEGLKKLAANYRNTFKANKLDLEKFRTSLKDKRALTDPRFRRERTRSPKKAAGLTQSESVFPLQDCQHGIASLSTPVFNMKNLSEVQHIRQTQNNFKVGEQITPEITNIGEDGRFSNKPSKTFVDSTAATEKDVSKCITLTKNDSLKKLEKDSIKSTFDKDWSKHSNLERICSKKTDEDSSRKISAVKSSNKTIALFEKDVGTSSPNMKSLIQSKTAMEDLASKYQLGARDLMKLNFLSSAHLWDNKLFSRNRMEFKDIRKSHSAVTLPICYHKFTEQVCMCVKCSYSNRKDMHGGYVFDSNTDMESLNSALISCATDRKPSEMERYYQCCLYVAGCFMGILFVAFLAWVISSDVLWSYFIEETPKKQSYLLNIGAFFGKWILFSLNYFVGTIYNIFVLPRNAVFQTVPEKHWFWKFVDNCLDNLL